MFDIRRVTAPQLPSIRISLRELLLLVALTALAVASIRYPSASWRTAILTVTIVVFGGGSIVAIVDRGTRQAFAIGVVLTMIFYTFLVRNGVESDSREYDPRRGRLPTTWISSYLYRPVVTVEWHDGLTGRKLDNFDPDNPPAGVRAVQNTYSTPHHDVFMRVVHSWWLLLLGYIGGLFARFVYVRRNKEAPAH
jgi:hypothetical protein